MNPQIGAALIVVLGTVIGAALVFRGVYVAAGQARSQKRGELAAAALSDYMKAVAESATASQRHTLAESLPDGDRRKKVLEEADDMQRHALEVAAHAKTGLLAFADVDALHDLASWDKQPVTDDRDQQRALLKVLNGIRHQLDTNAGPAHETIGLGLMFGWPD
jgi:hypothetical protein